MGKSYDHGDYEFWWNNPIKDYLDEILVSPIEKRGEVIRNLTQKIEGFYRNQIKDFFGEDLHHLVNNLVERDVVIFFKHMGVFLYGGRRSYCAAMINKQNEKAISRQFQNVAEAEYWCRMRSEEISPLEKESYIFKVYEHNGGSRSLIKEISPNDQ